MSGWHWVPTSAESVCEGIRRKVPSCGMICCIGGSVEYLTHCKADAVHRGHPHQDRVGAKIGLTSAQANVLFYGWEHDWPEKFARAYKRARSPMAKARVAVSLLKLVAKTRGKCLDVTSEKAAK